MTTPLATGWQEVAFFGASTLRPPLARLHDALAGRRRSAVDILCVGDSITEGTGASARTARWLDRLQDQLRAAYPVPGVAGGAGYIPTYTMADYPHGWSYGGNISANGTFGLARRGVVLKSPDGWCERSVYGTSIIVAWTSAPGLGTFEVLVDGTVAATIATSTAAGSGSRGGNRQSVSLGTRGAHTVRLRWKSGGDVYANGIFIRDGDESRGVRLIDSGQHGSSSADWSRLVNPATAYMLGDEVAAIQPAAVVIGLGPNDMIQGLSVSGHKANLLDIIAMVRANAAVDAFGRGPAILLHAAYQLSANYTYPWSAYVQNMRDIAMNDSQVALLDFSTRLPRANANPDSMIAADGIHLNDTGDGYYAGQFREMMTPVDVPRFDIMPRQRPVRTFAAGPVVARTDEVLEIDASSAGTGGITITPWADLRVGESFVLVKTDTTTNPVILSAPGGLTLTSAGSVTLTWDGAKFVGPPPPPAPTALRSASDYDDSVAPAASQAILWVPGSPGKWAPRTVVLATDSRLSDARTPTAHRGTHAPGGTDPIYPADIGAAAAAHTHARTARATNVSETVAAGTSVWFDASQAGTAGLTASLPASPTQGMDVTIGKSDSVAANPIRIPGLVNRDAEGARITTPGASVTLVYVDTTIGWAIASTNMGTGATGAMPVESDTTHSAYLAQSQTIPSAVDRVVWFPSITRLGKLVGNVAYSTGTKFQLLRAGVWQGTCTVRIPSASSGECYVAWSVIGAGVWTAQGGGFGGSPGTRTVPIFDWFDINTELYVGVYQSSGADRVIDHGGGMWCNVRLGWVHD